MDIERDLKYYNSKLKITVEYYSSTRRND